MESVYDSIMAGLTEAIEDAKDEGKKLKKRVVSIEPVKTYGANWESGTNHPSGAASRILSMMEMDDNLINKFPFVQM